MLIVPLVITLIFFIKAQAPLCRLTSWAWNATIRQVKIMESFLATLAFLGIAMVSVCGVVVLKIYNPNSNK